jgi:hypothetical protein
MVRELREGGDRAMPLVAVNPDHPMSVRLRQIASQVLERVQA